MALVPIYSNVVGTLAGVVFAIVALGPYPCLGSSDVPKSFNVPAENLDFVKREVMIPMRDGVKLHAIIIRPKTSSAEMPIILTRTPYGVSHYFDLSSPRGEMNAPNIFGQFLANGFVCVFQDIRGRYESGGYYTLLMPPNVTASDKTSDHVTDTWDTVDWLVKHIKNNNGRVGIVGLSYGGFLTLVSLVHPHPALKAAVPINPLADGWMGDDWYHNGAFRQQEVIEFLYQHTMTNRWSEESIPYGYRDAYSAYLALGSAAAVGKYYGLGQLPVWKRMIDHPSYDAYWQAQALQRILKSSRSKLNVYVLGVHGLFDQEDIFGSIASYRALELRDKDNRRNFLVIGPWFHGQAIKNGSSLGPIDWHQDTSYKFRNEMLMPFLRATLKQTGTIGSFPPVRAFDTGTLSWSTYNKWPPKNSIHRRIYLARRNRLVFSRPDAGSKGIDYDEFVSNPQKPVPYRIRPITKLWIDGSRWDTWLADDQRQFETRSDVLTYVSAPLVKNLSVKGGVTATLFASTDGSDADWVVKLIDKYPPEYREKPELGGYDLMVSGNIMRGRYFKSFGSPRPLKSGKVYKFMMQMPDVCHTFLRGHRIMIQIQSSWFPLYDRNPQTYVSNMSHAKSSDYHTARERIYRSGKMASFVEVFTDSKSLGANN